MNISKFENSAGEAGGVCVLVTVIVDTGWLSLGNQTNATCGCHDRRLLEGLRPANRYLAATASSLDFVYC